MKPCPFCGGPAMRSRKGKGSSSCCRSECYGGWIDDKTWESRPVEDSIRAEIARLRAAIVELCERVKACEDAGWTDDDATLTPQVIDLVNAASDALLRIAGEK